MPKISGLKSHSNYTKKDVVEWVTAQADATKEPGTAAPVWMIAAFEEAVKQSVTGVTLAAAQGEPEGQLQSDVQDDVFKFELVYFKVENTLFTVIKDWLTVEGSTFRDMFSLPVGHSQQAPVEGSSKINPIILDQTSATGFKAFLCLLYGSRGKPLQTYDEWVGALELARRWNFDQVCKQAITGLRSLVKSLRPTARITLAKRVSVGPWLRAGFIDLVLEVNEKKLSRNELIHEECALDMTTVANVFYACFELERLNRESTTLPEPDVACEDFDLPWGHPPDCESCKGLNQRRKIQRIVDGIFGAEIEDCRYTEEL